MFLLAPSTHHFSSILVKSSRVRRPSRHNPPHTTSYPSIAYAEALARSKFCRCFASFFQLCGKFFQNGLAKQQSLLHAASYTLVNQSTNSLLAHSKCLIHWSRCSHRSQPLSLLSDWLLLGLPHSTFLLPILSLYVSMRATPTSKASPLSQSRSMTERMLKPSISIFAQSRLRPWTLPLP